MISYLPIDTYIYLCKTCKCSLTACPSAWEVISHPHHGSRLYVTHADFDDTIRSVHVKLGLTLIISIKWLQVWCQWNYCTRLASLAYLVDNKHSEIFAHLETIRTILPDLQRCLDLGRSRVKFKLLSTPLLCSRASQDLFFAATYERGWPPCNLSAVHLSSLISRAMSSHSEYSNFSRVDPYD